MRRGRGVARPIPAPSPGCVANNNEGARTWSSQFECERLEER
ncbi:hypothetical protein K788_0008464 [Paraburkholderia caribensis MBA4]|uniref:Uncharacterized protein n=1 Tax=Paraburkholderia caribensis MBA4 TaxID=1323664 RepID=A0A0P0R4E6_9BURK|nr:hypothetical protein K788_0008464 [Paraburkholderia caribensis MBA4]